MSISKIRLLNFRNHSDLKLCDLSLETNFIVGSNGSGKTSILESISLLSPGKGMKSAKSSEILNKNSANRNFCNQWCASFFVSGSEFNISYTAEGNREFKTIREDTNRIKSSKQLLNKLKVVWLTPQMSYIFLQGSDDRRRFLDRIVYNHAPNHAENVANYKKLVRSRMKILKEQSMISMKANWLDTIEWQISELAECICNERTNVINNIANAFESAFDWDWHPIVGIESKFFNYRNEEFCKNKFSKLMAENRKRDSLLGRTVIGPHTDDFSIMHSKKLVAGKNCSTGEQKSSIIKFILAHLTLLKKESDLPIVLLLDDVFAHIDDYNKALIMSVINNTCGIQKWITGTKNDIAFYDHNQKLKNLQNTKIFSI